MQSIRNSILRHVRVRGSIESCLLAKKQIKKCDKIDASKVMDGVLCYYRYHFSTSKLFSNNKPQFTLCLLYIVYASFEKEGVFIYCLNKFI